MIVPFLAILAYKFPQVAVTLSLFMVGGSAAFTIYYTYKYDLKAGFLAASNYFMLQGIIAKPWLHLQNIGQGIIMALIYRQIIDYRYESN